MFIVYIRAIILYALIIFSIRLMGKRQIGELQPSELAITILISNLATLPIEDNNIPMLMGAVPIIALVGFEILLSNLTMKSLRLRRFISGNPVVIIRDGKIDQKQMKNLRFSIDDLMEALRENGVFNVEEVYFAVVETTGTVSVMQKADVQTITPKDLNLTRTDAPPPVVVISNGRLMKRSMRFYGIRMDWVQKIVKQNKSTVQDIFLMTVDADKHYYIVKEDGKQ